MTKAKKDYYSCNEEFSNSNIEKEAFMELLEDWELLTKELIKKISTRNDELFNEKSTNSIIAIGAMEVHLNMALQALNAFKDNKKD